MSGVSRVARKGNDGLASEQQHVHTQSFVFLKPPTSCILDMEGSKYCIAAELIEVSNRVESPNFTVGIGNACAINGSFDPEAPNSRSGRRSSTSICG